MRVGSRSSSSDLPLHVNHTVRVGCTECGNRACDVGRHIGTCCDIRTDRRAIRREYDVAIDLCIAADIGEPADQCRTLRNEMYGKRPEIERGAVIEVRMAEHDVIDRVARRRRP